MTDEPKTIVSFDFVVMPAKEKQAYPIPSDEWNRLKAQIGSIKEEVNVFYLFSSVLLGIASSAFFTAIALDIPQKGNDVSMPIVIAWFSFVTSSLCGLMTFFFGHSQRDKQELRGSGIVKQMEFIEKRYN